MEKAKTSDSVATEDGSLTAATAAKPHTAKRDPDRTRERLIQAAFQEIYRYGFRAASLETILNNAGVTKGALYHHFSSKTGLGHAVIEEVISEKMREKWVQPVEADGNPIDALIELLLSLSYEDMAVACQLGCPFNNLAQEMSAVDEGFRRRLQGIFDMWRQSYAEALRRGRQSGWVREDVDPDQVAVFIVSSLEGGVGVAKTAREPKHLATCRDALVHYLETLRAPGQPR